MHDHDTDVFSSSVPTDRRALLAGIGGLAAGALLAGSKAAHAGPLNPPGGPITSTGKTLAEVEPRIAINATNTPGDANSLFKITQPGSYYLTGNITGVVGKHGVAIAVSGVTLDLNGFDLAGVPGMGSFSGVVVTAGDLTNIAVINGSVRNWGGEGVDLGLFSAKTCRVGGVRASGNAGYGICVGSGCTVTHCSATDNASHGINVGSGCTVSNCSARENLGNGIKTAIGCTVTNCSGVENAGDGIFSSTVTNCVGLGNAGAGISVSVHGTVTNCLVDDNDGHGISASHGCTVTNCTAYRNTDVGIGVGDGCRVTNCTAHLNGNGITTSNGCTVADCTVTDSAIDGIRCGSACVIRGNTCSFDNNFFIGVRIHATGADNRIEGNTCVYGNRGIVIDVPGNIIIRNTSSNNSTNWVVFQGNAVAPIVFAAMSALPINGNTYGGGLGATDPNANFTH